MRRKLLMLLGAFLVIYLINFTIPRLMPGDPFDYVSSAAGDDGSVAYSEEQKEQLRAYYGLDKPFWAQLGDTLWSNLRGDFGQSIHYRRPVGEVLLERLPWSLWILGASLALSLVIGVGLALWCVRRRWADRVLYPVLSALAEVPPFLTGVLLLFLVAARVAWIPLSGAYTAFAEYGSIWARLGDIVTVRYVEETEYVDPDTGIAYASPEDVPAGANWVAQPVKYRDVEYEVAALVTVPSAFSYRYYGADEFILNDQTFLRDSGTSDVMYYAFDTADEANDAMEEFLRDYTENVNPQFDYESKALYASEFEGMRSMFQLCGGALSFIVGLVGVLNFFNAILTGIIARKREFAVLQSIGMTGRQLKAMLVYEGLFYALGAAVISLILTLALGPVAFTAVGSLFWFFTYRLTLTPFLIVVPVFALLGILVPLAVYRAIARSTIVERLRQE